MVIGKLEKGEQVGDKDLITEEFCERKHHEIIKKILEIDNALNGTGNSIEEGLRYRVQILWLDYQLRRKTTMGWIDWAYRAVLGVIVGYIAVRLGLQ